MSQDHLKSLGRHLAAAAKGRYAIVRDVRYHEDEKHDSRYQLVDRTGEVKASMTIGSLPGCCGVCLLHSFSRGKASSIADFIKIAAEAARMSKYGAICYTLQSKSAIHQLLLEHLADQTTTRIFLNGKTGNEVTHTLINLQQVIGEKQLSNVAGE